MKLPPDLLPGVEPIADAGVPAPHPGFDSLSEWFTVQPSPLPTGVSEQEVTQMWRDADRSNARDKASIKRANALCSCLSDALARLRSLSLRINQERGQFSHLIIVEVDDE